MNRRRYLIDKTDDPALAVLHRLERKLIRHEAFKVKKPFYEGSTVGTGPVLVHYREHGERRTIAILSDGTMRRWPRKCVTVREIMEAA